MGETSTTRSFAPRWLQTAVPFTLRGFGASLEATVETLTICKNGLVAGLEWMIDINRLRVLRFGQKRFPNEFRQLDDGDKRLMRSFLDPDSVSNSISLAGTSWSALTGKGGDLHLGSQELRALLSDTLGAEAELDTPVVEAHPLGNQGRERWFFINGIMTSREVARNNVDRLEELFGLRAIMIHNPTQGLRTDLVESALQKFTNVNTEVVALALVHIAKALVDPKVDKVGIIAHSQGTIIAGDVLDLVYFALDPKGKRHLEKTNMNSEDFEEFLSKSHGTIKSDDVRKALASLRNEDALVKKKLELYMFANAASRVCYLDPQARTPHIESFANEHDCVARLGCLAEDAFHREDLVRIDGPLFLQRRYGHLLNAHYLSDDLRYERMREAPSRTWRRSLHAPVSANPCANNARRTAGEPDAESRLLARRR